MQCLKQLFHTWRLHFPLPNSHGKTKEPTCILKKLQAPPWSCLEQHCLEPDLWCICTIQFPLPHHKHQYDVHNEQLDWRNNMLLVDVDAVPALVYHLKDLLILLLLPLKLLAMVFLALSIADVPHSHHQPSGEPSLRDKLATLHKLSSQKMLLVKTEPLGELTRKLTMFICTTESRHPSDMIEHPFTAHSSLLGTNWAWAFATSFWTKENRSSYIERGFNHIPYSPIRSVIS